MKHISEMTPEERRAFTEQWFRENPPTPTPRSQQKKWEFVPFFPELDTKRTSK
jgi:hypothetical protein